MAFRLLTTLFLLIFQSAFAETPHDPENCPDQKNHFAHEVVNKLGKVPCGLIGSVEERINECNKTGTKGQGKFVLVSRTLELKEIYLDESTGMLWGDALMQKMSHKLAMKACRDNLAEVGRIAGKKWRLPTIDEVKKARTNFNKDKKKHELMKPLPLPNMSDYQWTSSPSAFDEKQKQAFSADVITSDSMAAEYKVRCVATE